MGFENRDYIRDGSYSSGGGAGFMDDAPMCKRILIATVVVFVLQMFWTRPTELADIQPLIDRMRSQQVQLQDSQEWRDAVGSVSDDDSSYPDSPYDDQPIIEGQSAEQIPTDPYDYEYDAELFLGHTPNVSVVEDWLKLDTEKVVKGGQIWRVLTCAFLHNRFGVWHIFMNMLMLYWFGRFVESTYGSTEFLIFYLVAAVIASLAFIGLELIAGERHGAIGASGAVMAVVCVFTMWNPTYTIRMYFLFPIQIQYLLLFYILFDLHPVLLTLAGTPMNSGVGHAAHLGGLLFGFLYYRNGWRLAPYWNRLTGIFGGSGNAMTGKRKMKQAEPRVIPLNSKVKSKATSTADSNSSTQNKERAPKTAADLRFDSQLDDVLKKISDKGQDSLTDRERKVLAQASQRYRDRS